MKIYRIYNVMKERYRTPVYLSKDKAVENLRNEDEQIHEFFAYTREEFKAVNLSVERIEEAIKEAMSDE